ncbi:MAG: undecaprenyl-diphosphatase, partial [Nitrospiraceae bacterium]
MEDFNHALFLWLNAPEHPHAILRAVATFFAEY